MFDVSLIWEYWPIVLQGISVTLELTAVATLVGIVFGFMIALVKINRIPILVQICSVYVSFIRGVPIMVLLYMSYYGLPLITMAINDSWGVNIDINAVTPFMFAAIAFILQEAAYESEVIRAALLSVDRKEIEAAKSIGMTNFQTLWRIVIPQALLVAVPSFGNALTSLLKGTAVAFTISVMDVMGKAKVLGGRNFHYFEAYTCAALTYWIMCILVEIVIRQVEKRLNVYNRPISEENVVEVSEA